MNARYRAIFISVTCLGMSSFITQIVTLREFMNVLAGNELVIGLILANWLLLTGLGSYLGRFAGSLAHPCRWLVAMQVIIAILPFGQIVGIRLLKKFFVAGLMLGLHEAFIFSFILLLPYCLVSGFLLTLFSSLGGEQKDAAQIGRIYVLDVIGDIMGGLIFSFLLIYFFNPFQVLLFLLVLNLSAAILVSSAEWGRRSAIPIIACLVLSVCIAAFFDFEKKSGQALFPGQATLFQQATPYGTLAVTRSENQFTIYQNGVPVGSTQNIIAAEETIHFAMSQHENPRDILLVSGGLNGALAEALKYPLKTLDYVELDPTVVGLVKKFSPATADRRVSMIAEDARRHIRSTVDQYDAILIDLADPATAQLNRFYTLEFFQEVRKALRRDGVLGFGLSGAENYANPEISLLSSTIYRSVNEVFPNILIIPGSRQYYLASASPLSYDIAQKLSSKKIPTRYVNDEYLQARLTADRIAAARQMTALPTSFNRDFKPASYYGLLHYWLSKFQSTLLLPVFVAVSITVLITLLLAQVPKFAPPLALSLSGFSGMGLEIVILLAFQVIYGFVYQQLGVIITAFLLGTALGGSWSVRSRLAPQKLFFRLDLAFGLFSFLLVPILLFLQASDNSFLLATAPLVVFPFLTMCIGFLVGAQFPVAATLTFNGLEKTAGTLYGLDFLGAALGALLVSAFVVPLLGIINTCYLIGTLKLFSTVILWMKSREEAGALKPASRADISARVAYVIILLVFTGIGLLVYTDSTATVIYGFTFYPPYHWLLLGLLALGLLQAMQVKILSYSSGIWKTLDHGVLKQTQMGIFRWLHYIAFSLVVFFPLFRCYFKIPYLFCHVCPRQCVFGYLRPYLVPAALIMNIEKRYWCFKCCPIGTFFDCQARISGKMVHRPKVMKVVPVLILIFTALAYFKVSADLARPAAATSDWYTFFFKNLFAPTTMVIIIAALLIFLAFKLRRSFCELLCPVGALSDLILKIERLPSKDDKLKKAEQN